MLVKNTLNHIQHIPREDIGLDDLILLAGDTAETPICANVVRLLAKENPPLVEIETGNRAVPKPRIQVKQSADERITGESNAQRVSVAEAKPERIRAEDKALGQHGNYKKKKAK